MRIMIAGDLVPTDSNVSLFRNGDVQKLLGMELMSKWETAEMRIFNLEAPIIDDGKPITKSGPNLKIASDCVKGIKGLNPTLITVANNHIRDFGNEGWQSTKKILEENELDYIGAGESLVEANEYKIVQVDGKKIGFYACAEHEFSAVSENVCGANVFLGYRSFVKIEQLREQADFVIVLYHGGKEHYRYPTPNQQSICRDFVNAGANLVVCQHSHCVGCREEYANGTIIYGQGNFIFDYSNDECWQTSLIVEVVITEEGNQIDYIPVVKNQNVICEAQGKQREEILKKFMLRSEEVFVDNALRNLFDEYSEDWAIDYLYYYAGWNKIVRGIDKVIFSKRLIKKFWSKKKRTIMLGLIQCETHREIMETYLREHIDEK